MKNQGVSFPTDERSAEDYTAELARGIKLWARIDIGILTCIMAIWMLGAKWYVLITMLAFAIGCPIVMILGFSIGILQFLSLKRAWALLVFEAYPTKKEAKEILKAIGMGVFLLILLAIFKPDLRSALHSGASNLGWTKSNAQQYAESNINHEFCELLGDITGRFNSIRRDIERIERQGADATREKKQFNELLSTFNKVPQCKNCSYSLSKIKPYKLE